MFSTKKTQELYAKTVALLNENALIKKLKNKIADMSQAMDALQRENVSLSVQVKQLQEKNNSKDMQIEQMQDYMRQVGVLSGYESQTRENDDIDFVFV